MQKDLRDLRIIFMGTPEFAVASLEALINSGASVVGVVTAPDKPAGRGMQLQQSAIKKFSLERKLHILQPEKLKDPKFIEELKLLHADLQVVVAFRMLPEMVWNMPPMGTVNVHGSLLPQYRGAAPINWAIINGESYTGITTFKLKHEIDTGNILMAEKIEIRTDENAGELHDRMKLTGAALLIKTVKGLSEGTLNETPQDQLASPAISIRHAPKIFTSTCLIDWTNTLDHIYNLIRGLSPYPGSFTYLDEKKLKIYKAAKIHSSPTLDPGSFETDAKTYLHFACRDGYINVLELQIEGKKKLEITEFLKGYRFKN
ncbi:MAG: methionyl-tRNA formyltransferase [Ferruginibacter sp.]